MAKKTLTKDDVKHLARLANLELSDKEISTYEKQLSETLEYVQNLDELDTKNISPTNQTTNLQNVTFSDGKTNKRKLQKKQVFQNTKKKEGNYFVVDKVL